MIYMCMKEIVLSILDFELNCARSSFCIVYIFENY